MSRRAPGEPREVQVLDPIDNLANRQFVRENSGGAIQIRSIFGIDKFSVTTGG
jgi:hypothetical protein